jgi:t-SNARE complex subunit (syntaxin)
MDSLKQIEEDVRGLSFLVHELHDLIQEQAPELDSIEEAVARSHAETAVATNELLAAEETQTETRWSFGYLLAAAGTVLYLLL